MRKYNTDPEYKKKVDEDKRARALAERPPDPVINAFNIIIPLAPFGIPGLSHRFCARLLCSTFADVVVSTESHKRFCLAEWCPSGMSSFTRLLKYFTRGYACMQSTTLESGLT